MEWMVVNYYHSLPPVVRSRVIRPSDRVWQICPPNHADYFMPPPCIDYLLLTIFSIVVGDKGKNTLDCRCLGTVNESPASFLCRIAVATTLGLGFYIENSPLNYGYQKIHFSILIIPFFDIKNLNYRYQKIIIDIEKWIKSLLALHTHWPSGHPHCCLFCVGCPYTLGEHWPSVGWSRLFMDLCFTLVYSVVAGWFLYIMF